MLASIMNTSEPMEMAIINSTNVTAASARGFLFEDVILQSIC